MLPSTSQQTLVTLLSTFVLLLSISASPLPSILSDLDISNATAEDSLPNSQHAKRIYSDVDISTAQFDQVREIRAAALIIADADQLRAAAAALALLRAPPIAYYSNLIAFGASYTDNAHARSSQYAGSLRQYWPFSLYGGRYTNGAVAVEHMVDPSTIPAMTAGSSPVVLTDYAYGGSEIDNSLEGASWPAAKDQVAQYLSDVSSGSVNFGTGRVLHYFNSGINPVTAIWLQAKGSGFSDSAQSAALSSVTDNINALQTQFRSINTSMVLQGRAKAIDYIFVGIPGLEIVPSFIYQANYDSNALAFLKVLSSSFNSQLAALAISFRSEIPMTGKVFHFDLSTLWYSINASPSTYGISQLSTPCYGSSLCSNEAGYMYFDSLHPTTFTHGIMASKMNALINSGGLSN